MSAPRIHNASVVINPSDPEATAVQAHQALGSALDRILDELDTPAASAAFTMIFLARLAGGLAHHLGPDAVITLFECTAAGMRKAAPEMHALMGKPH